MGTNQIALPSGFVLDDNLPEGFVLDGEPAQPENQGGFLQGAGNLAAGAIRGAGSIGATILAPADYLGLTGMTNDQRRAAMDAGLQEMGAQPESWMYKGGKLAGEIAGTAGAGGVLAKGVMAGSRFAPQIAPMIAKSLQTGGLSTGAPTAKALSAIGARNAAIRLGGGAVSGGAMAGLIDPEHAGIGSVIGGAIPGVVKFGGASGKLLKQYAINPLFKPNKAAISRLVEDAGGVEQARVAIDRAIKSGKTISGEGYTLGQAGKNAGLAATERARSAVQPERYQQIYQSQREARLNALQDIGKDEVAVETAKEARDAAAKAMYNPAFESDLQRQASEQASAEARKLSQSGGIHFPGAAPVSLDQRLLVLKGNPVIDAARRDAATLAKTFGKDIGDPMESLEGLHYIKLAIDSQLNKPVANTSLGSYSEAALKSTKSRLMDAIIGTENAPGVSPMYGAAVKQYAEMSRPIGQMKVAQSLKDALTGQALKYGAEPKQAAEQYFRALKNAPSIAKAETGMRQPLNKIFNEKQLGTIKQVARELAKDVDLQNLGRGVGSDTAQKLARSNMLSSLVDLVNSSRVGRAAVNVVTAGARGRMLNQLDAMLQSPEYAGKALDDLTKPQRNALANLLANPAVRALPQAIQSK